MPNANASFSQSSLLDPSLLMLGAGAGWAAGNGTKALYIDWYDNAVAHSNASATDPNEFLPQRALVSYVLEQNGFNVSFAGDIPGNLSGYNAVVIESYWACEPTYEPIVRNYVSNGGGVVLLAAVPCYFAYDSKTWNPGQDLSPISEWFGASFYWYTDASALAELVVDNPFGTSLQSGDVVFRGTYHEAALTGMDADSQVLAHWSTGYNFAFTHTYGQGRVYYQAAFRTPESLTADFTVSPYYFVNVGRPVYFDASSSSVAWNGTYTTSIIEYLWDFGDGNVTSSATSNTTHTYLSLGFFKVTLTVFDDVGSNASYSQIARALVNAPGDAWITLSPSSLNVHPGDNFTIAVSASNVDLMDAWQVFLKYNLTVVKVTDLWVPSDNVFGDSDVIEQRPEYGREWFTYGMNYVSFRNALYVGNVSVTEGILFKANCTALIEGSTSIQIATKNNPVDISMNDYVGLYSTLLLYDELSQSGREIVQPVRAQNTALIVSRTIFIRADGSIDQATTSMQRDGDLYILTGGITSIADGIVVERDNIAVDGSGYTVEGAGAFTSSLYGIYLDGRSNVTIRNTNVKNFDYGIWLNSSSDNSINGNNITNNWDGISLRYSSNNSMNGNTIANNKEGIWLAHSSNHNSIDGNNIENNNYEGILFDSSSDNVICHNNFVNNVRQVYYIVAPVANVWDDGYPSGGNYWSDYDGTDANKDGIGDTPYIIDANNTDHYPLMTQYVIPEFPSFVILPLFFMATLLAVITYRRKHC